MRRRIFKIADLDRISAAVKEAEGKTSGEIVPYFVEQSDRYEEALWRGGFLLGSLTIIAIVAAYLSTEAWLGLGPIEIALLVIGAAGLGVLLVHALPFLKRFLAGNELLEQRVSQRAAQAFIAEEVFNTRDRTGIMLFLSLLEHKVLVIGDSGINTKVEQSEWEDVVARVVRGINEGRPADGLIDAIHQCGILLQKRGVKRRVNDTDELPNRLRVGSKRNTRRRRGK